MTRDNTDGVPTVDYEMYRGEVTGRCPECGAPVGLGTSEPENVERHPATPLDEPVTAFCSDCNTAFDVDVP